MAELTQSTQKLIRGYQEWYQALQPKEGVATLHVDEVVSRVAAFYEKMKGVIDWREEHLLRKTAIGRTLKRRLLLKKDGKAMAESFIYELIRGGHFPNDFIPETKIQEIQKIIDKYIFIIENSPSPPKEKKKFELHDWLLGIAACEVEETLAHPLREKALMDYMQEIMEERIRVREGILVIGGLSGEEKNTQIYIAIQRALFKLDPPLISYHLLKRGKIGLEELTRNIYLIWEKIEKELKHPLADKFYNICERYDTPYLLLGDIISKNPMEAKEKISQPETLEDLIKENYNRRLKTLKSRLGRAAIYATVSIFLSNILALLAIEIPLTNVIGKFNPLTIVVDILGPTFLMFFLVITIKPPQKGNFEQAVMEVMKIVYERERKDVYDVKKPKKRGFILNAIITILYLLAAAISFGLIIWGLSQINFPLFSYVVFIVFISLIAFAGAKIRERSKELQVTEEKGTLLDFFIDLFSLPILRLGKWLSARFAKYNVIMVLLNSFIDMPFQVFVEFLEQWRSFLKEKKEEIH